MDDYELEPVQITEWIENEKVKKLLLNELTKTAKQVETARAQLEIYEEMRDVILVWLRSDNIFVSLEDLSKASGLSESSVARSIKRRKDSSGKRPSVETLETLAKQ